MSRRNGRLWGRTLTRVAAGVDRGALQVMQAIWLSAGDPTRAEARPHQQASFDTYTQPALIEDPQRFFRRPAPAALEPGRRRRLPGGHVETVRWRSGYRTWDPAYQAHYGGYEANAIAWAEWWRHRQPGAPTAVCLHSWATAQPGIQRWVFAAMRLYLRGWDVVLPVLPFHGPRTPRQASFSGQLFPGTQPRRTNEAFGQSVWDVRALLGALRQRGAGPIGLMGVSLGGYTTALLAGLEDDLAFAVPILPMVSFADLLWSHGEGGAPRHRAEQAGVTLDRLRQVFAVHTPLRFTPRLPRERLLIVAGRGDRVCPPAHVEQLWRHWNQPELLWFDGGHIVHFGRLGVLRRVDAFMQSRVGAGPPRPR